VRLWNRLVGPASGRDAGQVPIALVVLVFFGLMMMIFRFGLPWGQAADQKAGSQASADAAALAAAEQITKDLPQAIDDGIGNAEDRRDLENLLSFLGHGYGRAGAVEYANLNHGEVETYDYDWRTGEINVRVRSEAQTAERHSFSNSRADVGLRLDDCQLDDDELPEPDPEEPPVEEEPEDPPAEEEPPPNVGTQLRCGDLVLHFTIDGENGRPTLDSSLDDLADQFSVRLTA
jgi:hypothetical protein